jgi:NAD(P)-dependent dehydrogenase (short-subunit alcohol dehydrogenase family)
MERALIIGSSGGIGQALCANLTARGLDVVGLSRTSDGLDITDETSVADHIGALDGAFDLVFVATGALVVDGFEPEKSMRQVTKDGLLGQFLVNAIGPMLVFKHALRLLPKERHSTFAALSARVGSIGDNRLGGWHSYRAAKAGLNQLIHGAAIELARTHPKALAVALHPGTVATSFTEKYASAYKTVSPQEATENLLRVLGDLRPEHSGGFYDWAGDEIPW